MFPKINNAQISSEKHRARSYVKYVKGSVPSEKQDLERNLRKFEKAGQIVAASSKKSLSLSIVESEHVLSSTEATKMEFLWLIRNFELSRQAKDDALAKNLRDLLCLPDSKVSPLCDAALTELQKMKHSLKSKQNLLQLKEKKPHSLCTLSTPEKNRLKDLQLRLKEVERTEEIAKLRKKGNNAYVEANRKMRKVLERSSSMKVALKAGHFLNSSSSRCQPLEKLIKRRLDDYIYAVKIQRWWRRLCLNCYIDFLLSRRKKITKIQAIVRGFVCRKKVKEWRLYFNRNVIAWQALIYCGMVIRILKEEREIFNSATIIQALWRGFLGRKKVYYLRLKTLRCKRERKNITIVQCLVRRKQARRKVIAMKLSYVNAVNCIQRYYRGFHARMKRDILIEKRETNQKTTWLQLLGSEVEWLKDKIAAKKRDLKFKQLDKVIAEMLKCENEGREKIKILNEGMEGMITQQQMESPRGMQQEWKKERKEKVQEYRDLITKTKLDVIFSSVSKRRAAQEELSRLQLQIDDLETTMDNTIRWKSEEFEEDQQYQRKSKQENREVALRRTIGNEKRRWQVKFYSPTGKPLKPRLSLNKDERKNDKCFSTFIGFCGGTVDVLADSRNYSIEESAHSRQDIHSDLTKTLEQIKLCMHLKEVSQLEIAMEPVNQLLLNNPLLKAFLPQHKNQVSKLNDAIVQE